MHIQKMMKVLTGQRAGNYQSLYSEMTLNWYSTSEIRFYITAMLGNSITIDWDEQGVEDTVIETTGFQQYITKSFSSSKERSITLKGSGVYVMTALKVNDHYDFKGIPLTSGYCQGLPNLKTMDFYYCRRFKWDTTPDWSLTPKLKTLNLQECYEQMTTLPLADPANRPPLQNLNVNYCYWLSGLYLTDFTTLKNLSACNLFDYYYDNYRNNENYQIPEMNLSGCSNLVSAEIYSYSASGFNFDSCSSMKSLRINSCQSGRMLDISNCTALTGLSIEYFGNNLPASAQCQIIRTNNPNYKYEYFYYCQFDNSMFPSYTYTPALSSIEWRRCCMASGAVDLSYMQNLRTFTMNECCKNYRSDRSSGGVSAIICNNNRTLSSIYEYRCYDIERVQIQNCASMYRVQLDGYTYDSNQGITSGQIKSLIVRNNPKLYRLYSNCNSLDYGYTITQCPSLYELYLRYSYLQTIELSGLNKLYYFGCEGMEYNSRLRNIKIDDCSGLYYIYMQYNRNMTNVQIHGLRNNYACPYIDYDSALTTFNLSDNNFYSGRMNDILSWLNNYAGEGGTVDFTNNVNHYKPDTSYITNLQSNKGWTVLYDE